MNNTTNRQEYRIIMKSIKIGISIAIFAALCVGCGYQIPIAGDGYDGPTNPQPGQTLATALVWNQTYGVTRMAPPPILWHFGDNCVDANSKNGPLYGTPGAFKSAHESNFCMWGQYESSGWVTTTEFDAPDRIDIEWNGSISFKAAFEHELCHAFKQYTTGDGDEGHKSDCFVGTNKDPYDPNIMSPEGSLVYTAHQALLEAGL